MIGKQAPEFDSEAYVKGEFKRVKLSDYKGKWLVLFFYPADFTFVCPTELEGFAEDYNKFKDKDTEISVRATRKKITNTISIKQRVSITIKIGSKRRQNCRCTGASY